MNVTPWARLAASAVTELALRRHRDPARDLARRPGLRLETQRAAVAPHARLDILEAPRDVAARVEVQHAAVADEHLHVRRHVEAEFIDARTRRRRALHAVRAVGGLHERELGAFEREAVDADVALSDEHGDQAERADTDARRTRLDEGLRAGRRRDARVAERELGPAPTPARIEVREAQL